MSSNLKVNSLVPATGTEIGIGTTGGSIDFRCPATFGGNVTIGGTLTYDEVINIDSIGIVTARSGLNVQAGQLDVGSNIKLGNAGVVTATSFVGSLSGGSVSGTSGAFTGNIDLNSDTNKLKIGAGDDFQFWHNGSSNFIWTNSGPINIQSTEASANGHISFMSGGTTERLRITSTGLVQVGANHSTGTYTWDPTFKVAVEQSANDPSAIHFGESVNGSANPAINFIRRDGSTLWSAYAGQISYDTGQFAFATAANAGPGSHSFGTRMVIGHNGNIGINSTTPSTPLEIHTIASAAWKFRINTSVSDGAGFYQRSNGDFEMVLRDASNNNNYIAGTSGALQFATAGTERLRITSTGSVGIGTLVPREKLDVAAGRIILDEGYQFTWANGTTNRARIHGDSGSNFIVENGSSNTERLRIASDGKATFAADVQINGDELFIADSIKHVGDTDTLISFPSNDTLYIRTACSERLRIKSDGNITAVGIVTAKNFNPTDVQLSHRNIIINGDMRVAQRADATNIGNAGNFKYACDRWFLGINGPYIDISQDTSSAGSNTHPNGFRHSYKIETRTPVGSVAVGNLISIQYKFEGYQVARLGYGSGALYNNPKSFTVSFWAKSSLTGTFAMNWQRDGRIINRQFTISSADTWEYFTATVPPDTSIIGQHENAQGMNMTFMISGGTNYTGGAALSTWINSHVAHTGYGMNMNHITTSNATFQITGVQLEEGTVATPFEFRDYNDQLKMCQRYYAIFHPCTQSQIYIESGGTNTHSFWEAPVPAGMRTEPSVNLLGTWTGGGIAGGKTISAVALQGIDNGGNSGTPHPGSMGRVSLRVTRNSSGTYSDRDVVHTDAWGNGNAWIGYDAEL